MQAIDVHAHYFPPAYLEAARRAVDLPGRVGGVARFLSEHPLITKDSIFTTAIDERLALMDAASIATEVLSYAAPNLWLPDPAARAELVRAYNDGCLELAHTRPGRFRLFANVPLPFVEESVRESERVLADPAVIGFGICTHIDGRPVDDPSFAPLYELWNERNVWVQFHPEGFCVPGVLDDYGMEWSLGALFDDTIVATRLIQSGMVERYPRIRWIVPHLGGTFPFTLGRLDWLWGLNPFGRSTMTKPPSAYLEHVYFDTVTTESRFISFAKDVVGASRLLFGTDFPYVSRKDLGFISRLLERSSLTPAERDGVLWKTFTEATDHARRISA
jgi:aminocarboxymuconate-semialdehyde decarboxylase